MTKRIVIGSFIFAAAALALFGFWKFHKTAAAATVATAAAHSAPLKYGVWLPFWRAQSGASDVSLYLNELSEVSPFSYAIGDGGRKIVDDAHINDGSWNGWFLAAHQLGVKIIPTVAWFSGQTMYDYLSNTRTRIAQENAISNLARTQKFDGIDIDYEAKLPKIKPYFALFIEGLAMRLHAQGKLLTCTVEPRSPATDIWQGTPPDPLPYSDNYPAFNKYCDEVRVMAYDQGNVDLYMNALKGNGTLYAPTADPQWVARVLRETMRWISPKKIMLGVPTYGYEYQVSWKDGVTTYERVRSFTFLQAMDRADILGIAPTRNNAGELSFTYHTSTVITGIPPILITHVTSTIEPAALKGPFVGNATNTMFVSFADSQSAQTEINLAKQLGLRGVIFFKADGELDPAIWGELH